MATAEFAGHAAYFGVIVRVKLLHGQTENMGQGGTPFVLKSQYPSGSGPEKQDIFISCSVRGGGSNISGLSNGPYKTTLTEVKLQSGWAVEVKRTLSQLLPAIGSFIMSFVALQLPCVLFRIGLGFHLVE